MTLMSSREHEMSETNIANIAIAACDQCGRAYCRVNKGGGPCVECGRTKFGNVWRLPFRENFQGDTPEERARRIVAVQKMRWHV